LVDMKGKKIPSARGERDMVVIRVSELQSTAATAVSVTSAPTPTHEQCLNKANVNNNSGYFLRCDE
jgi:hypothetical protein